MKKIFLVLIILFSFSLFFAPAHPAQAFMSLTDNIDVCLASGDCTICDVLTVLFNFAKFIYITMAGLVLLFIIWQSILIIMNFGNSENIKAATDKIKSTLLAALIILASYTLVGALITVYSGGTFKTFIKGQTSTNWAVGPICERGTRPENQVINNGDNQSLASDGGCKSSWEAGSGGPCGGNCGGLLLRTDARQCQDASPKLTKLLNCIRENLFRVGSSTNYPNLANKLLSVNSISISPTWGGGLMFCRTSYVKSKCVHAQSSCHFGGGSRTDGSHAVDIDDKYADGTAIDYDELRKLTELCDPGRYIVLETDHVHLSDSECAKD